MKNMKVSYNKEVDALLVQVGKGKIDHAEEMGPLIVHFTKGGKPILLEILDASEILNQWNKFTSEKADMIEAEA